MIAVAAALTLTALATSIWAAHTIRRPIDWTGKLTTPPLPGHMWADHRRRAAHRDAMFARAAARALRASERDDLRREERQ